MYALRNDNGSLIVKTRCIICTLAERGRNVNECHPMAKNCYLSRPTDTEIQSLALDGNKACNSYYVVYTAEQLLSEHEVFLCQESRLIVGVEANGMVCHDNIWHAAKLTESGPARKVDAELVMELELRGANVAGYYQQLMSHAIWSQDEVLVQYLQNKYPEQLFCGVMDLFYGHHGKRHKMLRFMSRNRIVDHVEALRLAIYFSLDYEAYLEFDLAATSDDSQYRLVQAITNGHSKSKNQLVIWRELQTRGLRSNPAVVRAFKNVTDIQLWQSLWHQKLESEQRAQDNFTSSFWRNPEADWSWLDVDFARSCSLEIMLKCQDRHDDEVFRHFLEKFYPADTTHTAEYEGLFLQVFHQNEIAAEILIPKLEFTPDLVEKCRRAFGQSERSGEFSMAYMDFLTQKLGIKPDVEWYIDNLLRHNLRLRCVVSAIKSSPELDWNMELRTEFRPKGMKHFRMAEYILYPYCDRIDVVKLVLELGLQLDLDGVAEAYFNSHMDPTNAQSHCVLHHKECFYRNYSQRVRNYALVKSLDHYADMLTPNNAAAIREIWQWVQDIFTLQPLDETEYPELHPLPYTWDVNPADADLYHWTETQIEDSE